MVIEPPDFTLRPRGDIDLEALAELWVASWRETMPDIDFEQRRAWIIARITILEGDGGVTICAIDREGRPLGFAIVRPQTHELDQIAVAPAAKGKEIARRLLGAAKALSPQGLVLDVNRGNPRAVRFYEREGFSPIGEGINMASGLPTLRLRWSGRDEL